MRYLVSCGLEEAVVEEIEHLLKKVPEHRKQNVISDQTTHRHRGKSLILGGGLVFS